MEASKFAALALYLLAAATAAAQIPRDPFPAPSASAPASAPPAASGPARELPKPFVTRQSDVEIPFSVKAGTTPDSQPTAVRVFVSWDQGQTWHFYDERKPEEGRFRFRARQDGEFWFATQTIDRSGKADTQDPKAPQLRLVIDTQRPQLLAQAQVDGSGNVNLTLSVRDASLNLASAKVEYQDAAGTGGPWQSVELRASGTASQLTGQTTFHPNVSSRSINLRAEVADAAGNVAYHSQRLSLNPPKPSQPAGVGFTPAADPSATTWPSNAGPTNTAAASPGDEQVRIPSVVSNPFVGPGRLASSPTPPADGGESLPPPVASEAPLPMTTEQPQLAPANNSLAPIPSRPTTPPPAAIEQTNPPPTAYAPPPTAAPETMPAPAPVEPVETPSGNRPRLTSSRRFSLEYDVETVGPEGLQAVELWGTTDGGRTWVKWGADPDKQSPFDVEVNNEAIYGFKIVVVGRNGLATSTPRAGDAADIWVSVDLTRPAARLTSAAYGQGAAAGKLDIRWEASDANLGSRPVTLAISDRSSGPFSPLAAGLPNTGQYLWEYDPRSPRQIFLRLEVRDEAGNTAIDQLTEPIKVEGLEPKGRIKSFNPGPEPIQGAFRPPLFR